MKEFLILPFVAFKPAGSDKKAILEMEKRNSWLVRDQQGHWYDRSSAFLCLVSRSPLLFWWAGLLRGRIGRRWGDKLYGVVANNRDKLGYYLKWLKEPINVSSSGRTKSVSWVSFRSLMVGVFFFLCFVYVIMWNVRTLDFNYYSKFMPKSLNGPGAFFHLHQYWNMFAPKPLDSTGWLILSAEPFVNVIDSDSEEKALSPTKEHRVDLWRGGEPLVWEKPKRYDMTFPVFRIRKMMENLVLKHKKHSKNYLKWLCGEWNKKEERIKNIQFIYMKQRVPPYGDRLPEPEKIIIRRKTCNFN